MSESKSEGPVACCWVRLVRVETVASEDKRKQKVVVTSSELTILNENRPLPKVKSVAQRDPKSTLHDVWFAPEEGLGRDLEPTAFEYGPAFDDVSRALEWLASKDGQKWDGAAINRMLICHTPQVQGTEIEQKACNPGQGGAKFPEDCWEGDLRERWLGKGRPPIVFLGESMSLPAWNSNDPEDQKVPRAPDEASFGNSRNDLHLEAHGAARVTAQMLAVVGLDLDWPVFNIEAKWARTELLDLVTPVIYKLKDHHKRPRPWMTLPDTHPLYAGDDWRNPKHPAYPSGHAVVAGLWQTLLTSKFSGHEKALKDMAEAIAQRRVAAALHFPSDIEHGLALGRLMGEVVLKKRKSGKLDKFEAWFDTLP